MKWIIMLLFLFSSFLLFTAVLQMLFSSNKTMDKRIKRYLNLNDKHALGRKNFNLLVQMQLYKQTFREKVLSKKKHQKLEHILARAGVPLKPEEYIMFRWISSALCGGLLFLFSGNPVFLFIGIISGYLLPSWWITKKQKARLHKFNEELQDMITTVIGSLRAGFSFVQALKTVVEESESPMKEEMEMVLREMQYGSTLEDALNELKERMPSDDLDLLIQSILIQKQIGGNLATILETIVQTIRDRNKIQRQIRTLTAQGRLSGVVIGLLPVALAFFLYLIEPAYIGSLFHHPIGILMVVGAVISGSIGMVMVRKMTKIEV